MTFGPCLCGADDCERCHPGSTDPVECGVCGNEVATWKAVPCDVCGRMMCDECAGDGVCEMCLKDKEAE